MTESSEGRRRENLLNVIQCLNFGGMEWASRGHMLLLREMGIRSSVFSLREDGGFGAVLETDGFGWNAARKYGIGGIVGALEARRVAKMLRPEIFLQTGNHAATALAFPGNMRRKILSVHFHHRDVKSPYFWRAYYEVASSRFDWVTFPSDFVRDEAIALCPRLAKIARTVRNHIPLQMKPSVGASAGQEIGARERAAQPTFGGAGWLIPRKRFDVVLRAFAAFRAKSGTGRLLVAGDGPERGRLEALARELGIGGEVDFLGWLRGAEPLIRRVDVMLFASEFDAFPTVPLEALAQHKPIVAVSSYGGLGEIMGAAEGVLFQRRMDASWMARQMEEAVCGSEAVRTALTACRERLDATCGAAAVSHQLAELVE